MIIYQGSFPIADGSQDVVAQALATARQHTLAEEGCHTYEFGIDVADPLRVVFHELYDDRSAFEAHMQADHTRALFTALGDHVTGRSTAQMYAAEPVPRDGEG